MDGLADVSPAAFREAMARYPTGVTVVTTRGAGHEPYGFTASTFCSVSLDPPLVLVCLSRDAASMPAFRGCDRFAINVLREDQIALAVRFATRRPDKFDTDEVAGNGLLTVREAVAVFDCRVFARHEAGDHLIIIGEVRRLASTDRPPAIYVDREFCGLRQSASVGSA
jgi:flavin reductase ActVB